MMYNIDKLTLISGVDIPIPELRVNIHQPTIREIAYIGEKSFYEAARTITMEKEKLLNSLENISEEDKVVLSKMSNFEVFLKLLGARVLSQVNVQMLLSILFPDFSVEIEDRFIMLINPQLKQTVIVDENNFEVLQQVITAILCLQSGTQEEEFNPAGDRAREIADKIKRGREKVAALQGSQEKQTSFLSRYISSLGVGTNSLNIHNILDLTLYQFLNLIERFSLYNAYSISIKAKMAGAKDVEDVDWLKDIEK